MIGILAEKPSAARHFAEALGGMNGIYNGEQYVIANSAGHLYEFLTPDKQVNESLVDKYHRWNVANLPWDEHDFAWKKSPTKGSSTLLNNIKATFKNCDEICIATDVDPTGEGELLAWEILDALQLHPKRFSRMYHEDEEVVSVQKAFRERKVLKGMLSDPDYRKADYRAKWDFMSMQFTRIASCYGDGQAVLRQGRLKSAMVRLVGDQIMAIKAYKKVPSYQNRFKDECGVMYTDNEEPIYPKKDQVPKKYHDSEVVLDSATMKHKAPPKLIDLAKLSAMAAPKGYDPKDVLSVYQKMYESKVVSYPRTEDKYVTQEQFTTMLPFVDKIARVVGVDPALLTHRTPRKTHIKAGCAHGANRPGQNVPNSLDELAVKFGACAPFIYETVARSYLAMLAEDYEYESQKGHLKDYPSFVGTCSVPKKQGYKVVFSAVDEPDEDAGTGLGKMAKPIVHEMFPPKPTAPTMDWLMKQLEKRDVGTGATRTSILSDVTNAKAKYPLMKQTKGKLSLTKYGDMSYLLLKDTHIGDLALTEQVMANMRRIAAGEIDTDTCLHDMQAFVIDDIATMKRNSQTMRKELGIMEQTAKEKCTGVWSGRDVSFNRVWSGHRFTDEECEKLLNGEEIEVTDFVSAKTGNTYGAKGKLTIQTYNGRNYVGFERTGFLNDNNGSDDERCRGTWNGREISFKKHWGGHDFTDAECAALLNGDDITISCVDKSGKPFEARGHLSEMTYNGHKYVGFDRQDNKGFPKAWCKHIFTDDEKTMLEVGKAVHIDGAVSKAGNVFECDVKYNKKTNKIEPQFGK